MGCIMIGIAGGTGSGKSTFTNRIRDEFGDRVTVVYHDNYYKSNQGIPFEERVRMNYDAPDAFDTDLFIAHLKALRRGESVESPVYDFTQYMRSDETTAVKPANVIIVEGILVLENPELRALFDIKVYVEADADERIIRRMIRDVKERGREIENIAEQYLTSVKPMHNLYVEPTRYFADIVVNSGMNAVALDIICSKIREYLAGA